MSENILILGVQVADTKGGAELLIEKLSEALLQEGASVEFVSLPFHAVPKSDLIAQMAQWRALDVSKYSSRPIDLVIPTKFPSYLIQHPHKIPWLIHQHRQAYELYGSRFGDFSTTKEDESLRRMIVAADTTALGECEKIFTISNNVSQRLKRYLGIHSQALEPPLPLLGRYREATPDDYILSVGRLCSIKRVDLIIKSLPRIREGLKLKIVGKPDEPAIAEYLESEIEKHHLWHRVDFLGHVSEEQLLSLYAHAYLVYYAPYDEDYGFVTLEALASSCPVVTAHDSGGVLEYVRDGVNGIIVKPDVESLAQGINKIFDTPGRRAELARLCHYTASDDWRAIARSLLTARKGVKAA